MGEILSKTCYILHTSSPFSPVLHFLHKAFFSFSLNTTSDNHQTGLETLQCLDKGGHYGLLCEAGVYKFED